MIAVVMIGVGVAATNGSNDVSKGIATLVGSGVTQLRRAILWGTVWTGAGSLFSAIAARALIKTFGAGLLSAGTHPGWNAAVATVIGAALFVAMATWVGLPVSTTHALVGAVAGVGVFAYGWNGIHWTAFGGSIIVPLLLSPVLALAMTRLVLAGWQHWVPETAAGADCLCLADSPSLVPAPAQGCLTMNVPLPGLHVSSCRSHDGGGARITMTHLHWLTSGATSFARGLNDSPKMVALLLGAALASGSKALPTADFFLVVAGGIVLGSWFAGRRVTDILAHKITSMTHREGFVANLVTASLVGPGAALGLPMSTTHVASGAIMGVAGGQVPRLNRETIRHLVLAWLVTLPGAALLGITVFELLHLLRA